MPSTAKRQLRDDDEEQSRASPSHARKYVTYATWHKERLLAKHVRSLVMSEKRLVFHMMREHEHGTHDAFLPHLGITTGVFCVWQILGGDAPPDDDAPSQRVPASRMRSER